MSSLILNIEILVACSMFIAVLFVFNLKYWKLGTMDPIILIYIFTFLCCYAEIGAFVVDGHPELIWANYLSNAVYLSLINLLGIAWMSYCSSKFPKKLYRNRKEFFVIILPALIEIGLLFTSPLTGLIFNVDAQGYYHRGDTFFIQFIPYFYIVIPSLIGIYHRINSQTTREKRKYQAIAFFSLPPIVFGAIQLMVPANSMDTLELSIAISLLACFANTQDNLITTDSLTRLPNRLSFDILLDDAIALRKRSSDMELYLLLGDLDGFKGINDNYGHVEGDRALVQVGKILLDSASRHGATATRFGGDEFGIVYEHCELEDAVTLNEEINEKLAEVSRSLPYLLHISFGISRYNDGQTMTNFLESVDTDLYRTKRFYKQQRAEVQAATNPV